MNSSNSAASASNFLLYKTSFIDGIYLFKTPLAEVSPQVSWYKCQWMPEGETPNGLFMFTASYYGFIYLFKAAVA